MLLDGLSVAPQAASVGTVRRYSSLSFTAQHSNLSFTAQHSSPSSTVHVYSKCSTSLTEVVAQHTGVVIFLAPPPLIPASAPELQTIQGWLLRSTTTGHQLWCSPGQSWAVLHCSLVSAAPNRVSKSLHSPAAPLRPVVAAAASFTVRTLPASKAALRSARTFKLAWGASAVGGVCPAYRDIICLIVTAGMRPHNVCMRHTVPTVGCQ